MKRITGSLRAQIAFMFLVAIGIILSIQIAYFISVVRSNNQSIREYIGYSTQQTYTVTSQLFTSYQNLLLQLGQNRDVQDLLVTNDPYEHYLSHNAVHNFCTTLSQIQKGVTNILLFSTEGDTVYYFNAQDFQPPELAMIGLSREMLTDMDGSWSSRFFATTAPNGSKLFLCLRPVIGSYLGRYMGKQLGFSCLVLQDEGLVNQFWERDGYGIYLLNADGEAVLPEENTLAVSASHEPYAQQAAIGDTGWSVLINLMPDDAVRSGKISLYTAFGSALTMLLLLIGCFILLQKLIIRPILSLNREIEEIDRNGFSGRITGKHPNEIGTIADAINQMLGRLQAMARHIFKLQDQMYESELREQKTRLYALQSQINPHFLFNTLQCIAGIAASHNEQEIVDVSLSLSRIFQYVIRLKGEITVRQEIQITEEYLKIIQVRFMGQYRYQIAIDDDLYAIPCQKMIFQPLVENAVLHGLENTYRNGLIQIEGICKEGKAVFVITDNGCGIPAEQLQQIQHFLSDSEECRRSNIKTDRIGLANIQSRVQTVYGPKYGLRIESEEGKGTRVTLTLPLAGKSGSA